MMVFDDAMEYGENSTSVNYMELYRNSTIGTASYETTTSVLVGAQAYGRYKFAKWLDDYSTYILTAVAVLGNTAALVTISTIKPRTSTSVYIAALSVVDTMCLVFKLLATRFVRYESLPQEFSCGFFLFMFFFWQYSASWLIVIVSLERCVAVWFPLHVSLMFTKVKALVSLVLVTILIMPLTAWTFWIYERYDSPKWGVICVSKKEYVPVMAIFRKIHPIIYIIVPFCAILLINMLIIVGLNRAKQLRRRVSTNSDKRHSRHRGPTRMTTMLLTTAITFLVLEVMMVILAVFRNYSRKGTTSFVEDYFFVEVAQTLEDANHAVNFFLYFFAGAKFRGKFIRLIGGKECGKTHPRNLTWTSRTSSYQFTHTRESMSVCEPLRLTEMHQMHKMH